MTTHWLIIVKTKLGSDLAHLKPVTPPTLLGLGGYREAFKCKGPVNMFGVPHLIQVYKDASLYARVLWASLVDVPSIATYGVDMELAFVVMDEELVDKAEVDVVADTLRSNGCECGVWLSGGLHIDYCQLSPDHDAWVKIQVAGGREVS